LLASVDDGSVVLTKVGGIPVAQLTPGTYELAITDRSTLHNFHLHGPGVDVDSGQSATGSTTRTVALTDGYYAFGSDPFLDRMRGEFTVGSPSAPSLTLTVGADLTLRRSDGAAVERLDPGRYVVVVDDMSVADNVHLHGPSVDEHTQVHTRTRERWTVDLVDGAYVITPSRPAARRGFLSGSGDAIGGGLRAAVGPFIAISLDNADATPLTALPAGAYSIRVRDASPDHDFHLRGPGVDQATSIEGIGAVEWTVRLRPGTYRFVCNPHAAAMFGSFNVLGPSPVRLTATLTRAGRATLSRRAGLEAGPYVVAVRDASPTAGLRLVGPGVSRSTGARFVGRATWRITLARGTYRFAPGGRSSRCASRKRRRPRLHGLVHDTSD
jgi:hypothetical protein